jgi:hypothetical protein
VRNWREVRADAMGLDEDQVVAHRRRLDAENDAAAAEDTSQPQTRPAGPRPAAPIPEAPMDH